MDEFDGIAPPSRVFARADALMNRRRPAQPEAEDIPVLTDVVGDDEVPLLDESLPPEQPASAGHPATEQTSPLAAELAASLRQRLDAELPNLVQAALNTALVNLTADLRRGIEETTRAALAEFTARKDR
ncbi:MAG TPA: hypothetical protein PKL28_16790 [Rhodocyclaceae bacterium]|jgi:hypothetical protein|nr:hypothetical protein [Rhodocyclaceae bacterium]HMW77133.1 hypothetical protein [Rhodocyclaceae bacterium]HNE43158.1 hypothetical protein [Rhodocyclaceae bacterium]HNM21208.1 hypothetical protein [Rhodocyclaceae bacterium]HNM82715.1 hypothetical protein [Rhodocyclaceae bacterium]